MIKPITGTFFEFDHHNRPEGKYYNSDMWSFSEAQWRAKVRETASIGMDTLVLMASALYDEVYYHGGEFPYAKHLACPNAWRFFWTRQTRPASGYFCPVASTEIGTILSKTPPTLKSSTDLCVP